MKVSVEEEEIILRRMKINGETNKSAHIKRVYFAGGVDRQADSDTAHRIDGLVDISLELRTLLRQLVDMQKTPIGLTLAAATLLLVYPSVQAPVQAKITKYIDMHGVEALLRAGAQ